MAASPSDANRRSDGVDYVRLLQDALDVAPPLVLTDFDGTILHANAPAAALPIWESQTLHNSNFYSLLDHAAAESARRAVEGVATSGDPVETRISIPVEGVSEPFNVQVRPAGDASHAPHGLLWTLERMPESSGIALDEQAWQTFLSDVGFTLQSADDLGALLQDIARAAVPAIGDWCTIDLLGDRDLYLRRVAVWHADPAKAQAVLAMRKRYPVTEAGQHPIMGVVTTGEPALIHRFDEVIHRAMTRDEDHFQFILSLGLRSSMMVPLVTGDTILGAMTFSTAESGRNYTWRDVERAGEFAQRAAISIDNRRRQERSDQLSRIREHYLSVASHEIRTPLAVVGGFASLLVRQFQQGNPDPERVDTLLAELQQGVERLELLTEDLLVASSLQQSPRRVEADDIDVVDLARDIVQRVRVAHPGMNGSISVSGVPSLVGKWSASLLDRALSNLVGNAVKYSGEVVDVRVEIEQNDRGEAVIHVSDSGIGIDEDDIDHLFMPFSRGQSARRMSEGTGLGLYITRQIIEQFNGTIDLQSRPGEGSTFTVTLPLEPAYA